MYFMTRVLINGPISCGNNNIRYSLLLTSRIKHEAVLVISDMRIIIGLGSFACLVITNL